MHGHTEGVESRGKNRSIGASLTSRRRVLRVVRRLSEAGRRHGAQGRMDTDGARAPYGYGKNHGYTRIVRLALPLLSSVAASSQGNAAESLAQHVRWHCRVSHVARTRPNLRSDHQRIWRTSWNGA